MASPLISILIPCHNAAPWLAAALRSALGQSWGRLEIIVVDDGSTDGSAAIAASFASSQCRVVLQEKRGASAARNRALGCSQGDLVQYLDADDFLAPDKLERQMQAIEGAGSIGLSFSSVLHFFDAPETGEKHLHLATPLSPETKPEDFLAELWAGNYLNGMIQTAQWLTSRELIEKAGPWNEELSVDDDGEFFTRVALAASHLVPVPEALCYYRKFRAGNNLSAEAGRSRAGRASALQAAKMKSRLLLARTDGPRARQAIRRLLTLEIVAAWPATPDLARDGLAFLQEQGLALAPLEGSPWFLRLQRWIGWKTARRLQWTWGKIKRRPAAERFRDRGAPTGATAVPGKVAPPAGAAHCSPHRAKSRLPV